MGIGALGAPNTIIKRKFRYDFSITPPTSAAQFIPTAFVKNISRPELEIDELELQFLNASTWIPGKGRWQPLTVTFIDTGNTAGDKTASMQGLYDWIVGVYNFQGYYPVSPNAQATSVKDLSQNERAGWEATATINMYDGCGGLIETWTLAGVFPTSVKFSEMDYTSSDEATIDLTLRFDRANLYGGKSNCGYTPVNKGCYGGCAAAGGGFIPPSPT